MPELVRLDDHRRRSSGGNRKGTRRRFGYLRKRGSGRWQASYLAPDGQRHNGPTTFSTKASAEAWLSTVDAAITERRWRPPAPSQSVETFGTYAMRWLDAREVKPRTRAEYDRLLRTKLLPAFAERPIVEITTADVRDWYATLDRSAPTAKARTYELLRTILNGAVDDELLTISPAKIRRTSVKRAHTIRPATLDELATITEAMPDSWRLLPDLAAWCALRFGELTELRRRDVDLGAGVIRVRRGVTWVHGEPIVGPPKSTAGVRDVSIPPHLLPALSEHLGNHVGRQASSLLFTGDDGRQVRNETLRRAFVTARSAAERDDLHLHDLRHTGAVYAALAGATTRELMDRLGHSTAAMALRYQHVADGRSAEIARRLSAFAAGEQP